MHAVVSSPVRTASSICEPRASSEMLTCCGGIASALRSIEHATIRRPINLRCLVAQRWFGRLGLELSPSAVLPYDWTLPWQTRVQRHKQAFDTPRPDTCFTLPSSWAHARTDARTARVLVEISCNEREVSRYLPDCSSWSHKNIASKRIKVTSYDLRPPFCGVPGAHTS
jgi:hypothetical protein